MLKPGGRFAVSDVVFLGSKDSLPAEVARKAEMWSGCVSGALEKAEYEELLFTAGFEDVSVEATQVYTSELVVGLGGAAEVEALRSAPVASAFVRARKPIGDRRQECGATKLRSGRRKVWWRARDGRRDPGGAARRTG